ncbi:GntR family transcriptional regulator [Streptomyces albireticuli]|uniref:GntR family transcriptional regulator n=1 Tax=Streptomyces albireticuli TaxID=1940 RepID=UPI001E515CE3|nr:GntR family transcriptional regulator [Streptomyces albireticuli]MCD9144429.1 GntR family transcriptional regulator [Streptomyces albireticuli]MCD9163508.1 GntR family transcriptional regulator [Streptomyces albireticuli]MCD9193106.1 GntR family transcriptional regulator [Streptomyces albireticuli]
MIAFRIDRRSGVATYLQLVHQVRQALRLGALEPGDRLPTAREVVAAVAINPNTVLRAYRELEREGLVEPRPGQGTFVQRSLSRAAAGADSPLRAEAVVWVARARAAGLEREDVEALAEAVLDETFYVAPADRAATPAPAPGPTPSPERVVRRSPQSMEEDT